MTAPTGELVKFVRRHRCLTRDEFWFEIDEYRCSEHQFLLAHLRVVKFSATILKRILHEWKLFRSCVTAPLFAVGEQDDRKWRRFVSLLGFEPHSTVTCENGEVRSMFIHKQT